MKNVNTKIKASDHESYGMFTVLAILFAPVAFIIGIVYITKSNSIDRKLGEHLIAFSVFVMISSSVFWYIFAPRQLISPTIYTNPPAAITPVRDIGVVYDKISVGMAKADVEAVTERASTSCAESDAGAAGIFESCSYGSASTDNGLIVVNYANGVVTTKSKAYF